VLGIDELTGDAGAKQSRRAGRRNHLGAVKVFIVSEMEGVSGIVKWQQVTGGHNRASQRPRYRYGNLGLRAG